MPEVAATGVGTTTGAGTTTTGAGTSVTDTGPASTGVVSKGTNVGELTGPVQRIRFAPNVMIIPENNATVGMLPEDVTRLAGLNPGDRFEFSTVRVNEDRTIGRTPTVIPVVTEAHINAAKNAATMGTSETVTSDVHLKQNVQPVVSDEDMKILNAAVRQRRWG